jgi:gluconolactonase
MLVTIASSRKNIYHEGPVWLARTNEVFLVSDKSKVGGTMKIKLYRVNIDNGNTEEIVGDPEILMANGAAPDGHGRIALCSQGYGEKGGGVVLLDPYTGENMNIVRNVYNSPNDIVFNIYRSGFWFTDPTYGFDQGFRAKKAGPEAIYYSNEHGVVKMVYMEGQDSRPNGLAISPDGKTLYYGDSGRAKGVFSFRINDNSTLSDKKLLYRSKVGIPDGIKCDREGRILVADGEGVHVLFENGNEERLIEVDGGVVQLVFCDDYLVMLCNTRLLKLKYY